MKMPHLARKYRAFCAILAIGLVAGYNALKFDLPALRETPIVLVAFFLVFGTSFFALHRPGSSKAAMIFSAIAAIGFSSLTTLFSGHFGLSSFDLASTPDIMAVSSFGLFILGLVMNGLIGRRPTRGRSGI